MFFPVPPRPEPDDEGVEPQRPAEELPRHESIPATDTDARPVPARSGLRVALGALLGIAVVISSALRLPKIFWGSTNSDYDHSYFWSTIGFTLLLVALSLWLIRTGLWPQKGEASGTRVGRRRAR